MNVRTYRTPEAFKMALEQKLRSRSSSGGDFARRRQLLVFDRFLARVVATMGDRVILKGGLVIELRIERARTTKDIDLSVMGDPGEILEQLREAGRLDLGDFMTFEISPDAGHPVIQNEGMRYDGLRYRSETRLAGKIYGQPFGVDVAFGDPIFGEPDVVLTEDVLNFAGVAPPAVRLYPVETQIAEKLHALTMPRDLENSRVKDLPDIALLALVREIDETVLRKALELTFGYRATHTIPTSVPEPPDSWGTIYARMAIEDQLPWASFFDLVSAVGRFMDPILSVKLRRRWDPIRWEWSAN
ncbi:MAG: nucleotidyl transferase AbiEii/AbiGii toxin family protein [Deltaproteobacteria bacterium]|nr:nucleotidyl transferase AbiEii/AbiGii toxin family protein [Deltaproteobacteria bacterium]